MSDDNALRGYTLLDSRGNTVGPVTASWLDAERRSVAFVAVRAGVVRARDHVVPLRHARLDEERRRIHAPYERGLILEAPALAADDAATPEAFDAILAHYRQAPPGQAFAEGPAGGEIPLHRERVDVGKRVVESGGIRLRKVVRREIVHVPVEVRREEIVVERVPPGESPAAWEAPGISAEPFVEGALFLPEYREEPVVAKATELAGGVRATRHVDTVHETVRAEARREDVEVERGGPTRRHEP